MGLSAASKRLLKKTGGAIKKAKANYKAAYSEAQHQPSKQKLSKMMSYGYRP